MLKEFRDFIARGNVLELAVAVIIGAAFGKIIDSLVADIINPIIGLIFGQPDFSSVYINLSGQVFPTYAAAKEAGVRIAATSIRRILACLRSHPRRISESDTKPADMLETSSATNGIQSKAPICSRDIPRSRFRYWGIQNM